MEPSGYKLFMNKFRLTIRRFLIIRGLGSGSIQTGVGCEPLSLPVEQHRRKEEKTEWHGDIILFVPPGMAFYHLLIVQSNSPGAEFLEVLSRVARKKGQIVRV